MRDPGGSFDGPATLEALPRVPRHRAIRLSAGEPPPNDDDLPAAPWLPSSGGAGLPRVLAGARVLVVDDDEDTVELFAVVLTACGAAVITATSAPEALRLVAARSPHVVVSDIAMPGADGYWLVREIRRLPDAAARAVPVVAVTAFAREHGRARVLSAGFADQIEKPVAPETLCLAVARAWGR